MINEDASRRVHIMEENGDSYKPESKIAVFTGASNVGGWYVHEWMWHNEADTIQERRDEISKFYIASTCRIFYFTCKTRYYVLFLCKC